MDNPLVAKHIAKLTDPYPDVRLDAARVLGEIGDVSAVPALIEASAEGSESAVDALGVLVDSAAVPVLIDASGDDNLQTNAIEALGRIEDASAVSDLINALRNLRELQ